jgi:hypothetical protein
LIRLLCGLLLLACAAARAAPIEEIIVVAPSPLAGTDPTRAPYTLRSIGGDAVERTATLPRALESSAASVNLQNALGNELQPNLRLRGFDAAPLEGVPQGIAVYVDGARANEAFGDTVNWDLIPDFAIERIDIAAPTPSFGFNALGGAALVHLKTGFTFGGRSVRAVADTLGLCRRIRRRSAWLARSRRVVATAGASRCRRAVRRR